MRLVVDTNIWVTYLFKANNLFIRRMDRLLVAHTLLYSENTLQELIETLQKPKLLRFLDTQNNSAFIRLYRQTGEKIKVTSNVLECRDPKDNQFLALAMDGNADFLITGDKDLLTLGVFNRVPIVPLMSLPDDWFK